MPKLKTHRFPYEISGLEHIDKRYVFTFVNQDDSSVVIDKLYLFEPTEENGAQIIHATLNSLYGE